MRTREMRGRRHDGKPVPWVRGELEIRGLGKEYVRAEGRVQSMAVRGRSAPKGPRKFMRTMGGQGRMGTKGNGTRGRGGEAAESPRARPGTLRGRGSPRVRPWPPKGRPEPHSGLTRPRTGPCAFRPRPTSSEALRVTLGPIKPPHQRGDDAPPPPRAAPRFCRVGSRQGGRGGACAAVSTPEKKGGEGGLQEAGDWGADTPAGRFRRPDHRLPAR